MAKSLTAFIPKRDQRTPNTVRIPVELMDRFGTKEARDGMSWSRFIEALLRREAEARKKK